MRRILKFTSICSFLIMSIKKSNPPPQELWKEVCNYTKRHQSVSMPCGNHSLEEMKWGKRNLAAFRSSACYHDYFLIAFERRCVPISVGVYSLGEASGMWCPLNVHSSPHSHLSWNSWPLSFLMKFILLPLAQDLEMLLLERLLEQILKILIWFHSCGQIVAYWEFIPDKGNCLCDYLYSRAISQFVGENPSLWLG